MAAKTAGVLKVSQVSYLPYAKVKSFGKTQINPNLQMGEKEDALANRVDVCDAREQHADNKM